MSPEGLGTCLQQKHQLRAADLAQAGLTLRVRFCLVAASCMVVCCCLQVNL